MREGMKSTLDGVLPMIDVLSMCDSFDECINSDSFPLHYGHHIIHILRLNGNIRH